MRAQESHAITDEIAPIMMPFIKIWDWMNSAKHVPSIGFRRCLSPEKIRDRFELGASFEGDLWSDPLRLGMITNSL